MTTYSQTFDYLYDQSFTLDVADVIETQNDYLLIAFKSTYPNFESVFIRISKTGQFISDSIDNTHPGYMTQKIHKYNQNYLLIKSILSGLGSDRIVIQEVDSTLKNQISSYAYSSNSTFDIANARILSNNQLLMVGNSFQQGVGRDAFVYQFNLDTQSDTMINLGNNNPTLDLSSDILMLGGKYYVFKTIGNTSSNCATFNEISRYFADWTHDTTVAICNSISTSTDHHFRFIVSALKISESDFMMAARADYSNSINTIRPEQIGQLHWDTNFVELNASLYGKYDTVAIEANQGISRFSNHPFVFVGGTENYKVNPAGVDTTDSFYTLIKTDLLGNPIWTRYYSNHSYLQLRKVLATSDGGAIMVGSSYDENRSNNSSTEKELWILKVDSNGNMSNSNSIIENKLKPTLLFYPNPVNNILYYKQINSFNDYSFQLYDSKASVVLRSAISNTFGEIDVSQLINGVYFYLLFDNNGLAIQRGKIIKQ